MVNADVCNVCPVALGMRMLCKDKNRLIKPD